MDTLHISYMDKEYNTAVSKFHPCSLFQKSTKFCPQFQQHKSGVIPVKKMLWLIKYLESVLLLLLLIKKSHYRTYTPQRAPVSLPEPKYQHCSKKKNEIERSSNKKRKWLCHSLIRISLHSSLSPTLEIFAVKISNT